MDSPATRPEAQPRQHRIAITLWCAFLGAALVFCAVLMALPGASADTPGELSAGFLGLWALLIVPVGFAVVLAAPHHGR